MVLNAGEGGGVQWFLPVITFVIIEILVWSRNKCLPPTETGLQSNRKNVWHLVPAKLLKFVDRKSSHLRETTIATQKSEGSDIVSLDSSDPCGVLDVNSIDMNCGHWTRICWFVWCCSWTQRCTKGVPVQLLWTNWIRRTVMVSLNWFCFYLQKKVLHVYTCTYLQHQLSPVFAHFHSSLSPQM